MVNTAKLNSVISKLFGIYREDQKQTVVRSF